ncbi:MAG TPA: geranylgeranylglycerol-phosphate geranylgeranyltransferase [Cyclobacteriaceae bacterium]|nr:geranylgeranylglycerol-phosphate geranylgeranyltransferase [Cyclobacteriaceae bacterium]
MSLIRSILQLTRFWNLIILGLTQYCAAGFLISADTVFDLRLFILMVSTILIAAAGYIINDYYDVKIDLINKPERVVIGKGISRRYAIFFHTALSMSGVGMGFVLHWKIGLVNFFSSFLLWLYSNALKRLPFVGNFAVALLTGLSVFIVNLLFPPLHLLVIIYALFAFFITLLREIIKDTEDLKGDHTFGCKTLPIVWGIRKTKYFMYGLLVTFSILVWIIHLWITPLPMTFFAWALFLPLVALTGWLVRADTVRDYYQLSQFCKAIMLAGIVSMALL